MINKKRLGRLGISASVLLAVVLLWWQRWNIYDYYRVRNYEPAARIVQLTKDTSMNDYGRRLFYVYHPELNDKQAFNDNCHGGERTIVLGCYVGGTGIYLYNVTEPRLEGVVQVTSAHEMLHAAYGRLSKNEKQNLDKLLHEAYKNVTDQRIKDSIDDYRRNGADITNELHSILGTEVRKLPPELEQYYKRYFDNRVRVVEYSEKYEQAFIQRKQQVSEADKKLAELKQEIQNQQDELENLKQNLDSDRRRLDALLAQQRYEEYNAGVPGFNQRVNNYNAAVRYIGSLIDQYNSLVAHRNAIALEEKELVKAIDSRPGTIEGE